MQSMIGESMNTKGAAARKIQSMRGESMNIKRAVAKKRLSLVGTIYMN